MAIEVRLEIVHDVDFLRTSMGSEWRRWYCATQNTYRSEAFVPVERVPAKAHHHWVHLGLLASQAIHLCIAKVNPWLAHATHRNNRFIGKIRCPKRTSLGMKCSDFESHAITHLLGSQDLSRLCQNPSGLLQIGRWEMVARQCPAQLCLGGIFGKSPCRGGQRVFETMPEVLLLSFLVL
jgi:hypothetical protein